jgi:hypothetical protein
MFAYVWRGGFDGLSANVGQVPILGTGRQIHPGVALLGSPGTDTDEGHHAKLTGRILPRVWFRRFTLSGPFCECRWMNSILTLRFVPIQIAKADGPSLREVCQVQYTKI